MPYTSWILLVDKVVCVASFDDESLWNLPATAVTPAESGAMLLYNGSRVHELVGLAGATGLFVWFLFWFKNDPGASLDTWR